MVQSSKRLFDTANWSTTTDNHVFRLLPGSKNGEKLNKKAEKLQNSTNNSGMKILRPPRAASVLRQRSRVE